MVALATITIMLILLPYYCMYCAVGLSSDTLTHFTILILEHEDRRIVVIGLTTDRQRGAIVTIIEPLYHFFHPGPNATQGRHISPKTSSRVSRTTIDLLCPEDRAEPS